MKNKTDAEMREIFRQWIAVNHVNQTRYARKLGVSNTYVNNIVRGNKPFPGYILEDLGYEPIYPDIPRPTYRKIKK